MAKSLKKRGQKIFDKFSRASIKAGEEGKEHIKENLIGRFSHIKNIKLLVLEWGLLILALIMLAATQSAWFSNSYAEKTFIGGGVYTEATIGGVNSLNPLFAITNSEKVLSRLLFATLITNDYSGHAGIGLAESVISEEDGKVWKVRLRDGLKWSDSEPITNEDVLFTTDIIKNPSVNTIYGSVLQNVKISETEEGEIIFTLPSSYADFMSVLNFPILPKHILGSTEPGMIIEHDFSKNPTTSGPFNFNASQPGSSNDEIIIYLSSNPNYYKGKTMLNSFSVHTYPNKEKVLNALNSGSITATAELDETDSSKISSNFLKKNSSLNSGAFIFFNTASGPTKDLALRRAIQQGLNMNNLREAAPETAPLDYPLLPSQIELINYPKIPESNFEAAKQRISELAGEKQIHLNIATVNSGSLPNVTARLADELRALNIEPHVEVYEETQDFITRIISKREYDILVYAIELGADPDLLPYYHSSQASTTGLNLSNYRSSLVDDLLLGARETTDEILRTKKYESFLAYWVNDVPAISLYQPNLTYYYNKNVQTFGNNVRLVTALDRFCDVNTWSVIKDTKDKTP